MDLQLEALLASGLEVTPRLLDGEDVLLAEDVGKLGQPFLSNQRKHLADVEIDERVLAPLPFGRCGVGAHEGGDDVGGVRLVQPTHDAQLLHLRVAIEAVATLALHGGDAEAQHGVESAASNLEQLVLRGLTRGPGGVDNTAAAVHDLHITVAAHAPRELLLAVSAEDEVRVRIDEARQQGLARGVDDGVARFVHRQRFARVKHVRDAAVGHDHCPAFYHMQVVHLAPPLTREAAARHHLRCVLNNQVLHLIFLNVCMVCPSTKGTKAPIRNDRPSALSLKA